jgi:hypothetical protein
LPLDGLAPESVEQMEIGGAWKADRHGKGWRMAGWLGVGPTVWHRRSPTAGRGA